MPISNTATISIRREGSLGIITKYKVLIDNVQIGELSHGGKAQFTVVPGSHIVQVKLRNELSPPLTVEIQAGEVIELVCGQDPSKIWSFAVTVPLYLREAGTSNSSGNIMQPTIPLAIRLLGEDNIVDSITIIDVEE